MLSLWVNSIDTCRILAVDLFGMPKFVKLHRGLRRIFLVMLCSVPLGSLAIPMLRTGDGGLVEKVCD